MDKAGRGILYLCTTPIGNLEDITLRVLKVLNEVDFIAAEDTRHTLKLLNHYDISKPLISYHEHSRREKSMEIIALLKEGKNVAYCSDAGMPGISDPGADLIRLARDEGIQATVLPGPSASLTALVLSGLPTERFVFEGFLPRDKKQRVKRLDRLAREERTIILYEAPHRVRQTIKDLYSHLGNRRISIVRELTKLHEEVLSTSLEEATAYYDDKAPRGEYVLVLEGRSPESDLEEDRAGYAGISIEDHIRRYMQAGMTKMEAVKQAARDRGLPKSEVYAVSIEMDKGKIKSGSEDVK
ncbi:MAG TPA: 16S rRNA (cytidine(1402)-2'-O)-methyltransferase [Candidatus Atribacteria bacterium]|nr:16S rRNA (cytidine(1402)-2'-O)-methyltransferase [Candidatus Atribacteria bacterium]HPT78522.1 16S rRNA (cytidine(1402)-2'-O)-methyltransferase [Candidatus Atribacteria bacterium]